MSVLVCVGCYAQMFEFCLQLFSSRDQYMVIVEEVQVQTLVGNQRFQPQDK